jgi:hypothetical protein
VIRGRGGARAFVKLSFEENRCGGKAERKKGRIEKGAKAEKKKRKKQQ